MKHFNHNYYDSDYNDNKKTIIFLNVEDYTNKQLKKYCKSVGKSLLKEFFNCYVKDISNEYNLIKLNDSIIKLKESFNVYMMDIYYDNEYLYKNYSINSYLSYSNNKINLFIKEKIK